MMPMDDDDEMPTQQGGGALDALINPTTTPEAQQYARRILNRGNTYQQPEDDIVSQMQGNADVARSVLQQARERLLSQQYDPTNSRMWLTAAHALTAPSHGGTFAESLGNLSGAMNQEMERKQQFGQQQATGDEDLGLKLAGVDQNVLQAKLGLAKLHEQGETSLEKEALQTMGRSIKPAGTTGGETGQFEDLLRASGIQEGSPEWNAKLQALITKKTHVTVPQSDVDYQPKPGDYDALAAIKRYDQPYPGGFGSNNPRNTWLKNELGADQGYSSSNYPIVQAARMDFTKGQGSAAGSLTALNTAVNHMHTLRDVTSNLNQGQYPQVNSWLNSLGYHVGTNARPSADLVSQALADEITRTLINNGGGEYERKEMMNTLGAVKNNKAQIDDLINTGTKLLAGRIMPLRQRFQVTGWGDTDPRFGWNERVSPDARLELWKVTRDPSEQQPPKDLAYDYAKVHPEARDAYTQHYGEPEQHFAEGGAVDPFATAPVAQKTRAKDQSDDPFAPPALRAPPEDSMTAANVAKSLEQGATLRFGDELNASLEPGDYKENVANEREQLHGFQQEHPIAATTAEIAGGAGSTAAALAALRALHGSGKAGAVERLLSLAAKYVPEGHVIRPAVIGSILGAAAGAGGNEDPENMGKDIALQGGAGAVLGPAGSLVGRGIAGAGGSILDRIMGQRLTPGVKAVAGSFGDDPETALNALQTRLSTDARAGVPSTVGDAATGDTRAIAQAAMRKPTPEAADYDQQLQDRQANAPSRASDIVNKGLVPDPYLAKEGELTDQLYQNAKPLYDQAYSQFPRVKSDELFSMMSTPSGKTAAKSAFKMMQDEGVPIGDADVKGMVRRPSLQYLDYVKRALDDQIQSEEGSGVNYAPTNQGRILRGMRDRFVKEIDDSTTLPDGSSPYSAARAQYKGDLEVRDALRSGLNDFDSMQPDQLAQHVGGMSYAEKDAFRSGVAESLFQKLRDLPAGSNPAKKLISHLGSPDKFGMLFDNPSDSRQFITGLQREMQLYDSSRALTGAAASGRNAAANTELSDNPLQEGVEALARRGVGSAIGTGLRRLLPDSKAPGQIADIMSNRAGPEANDALAQLRQAVQQIQERNKTIGTFGTIGAGAVGPNAPGMIQ